MERPLYLDGDGDLAVELDGPSLWIEKRGQAGSRVPLRMISRVLVSGGVKFDSAVVTTLAGRGVPLVFMERSGGVRVTALLQDATSADTCFKVRRFLSVRRHRERVEAWLRAERHNVRLRTLKKFHPGTGARALTRGLREGEYEAALRSMLPGRDREAVERVARVLRGLFHGEVLKAVFDAGIDPHVGALNRSGDFAFVRDICFALDGELERQLVQFFRRSWKGTYLAESGGRWELTAEGMRNIVVRFENRRNTVSRLIDDLLCRFFELVRET